MEVLLLPPIGMGLIPEGAYGSATRSPTEGSCMQTEYCLYPLESAAERVLQRLMETNVTLKGNDVLLHHKAVLIAVIY